MSDHDPASVIARLRAENDQLRNENRLLRDQLETEIIRRQMAEQHATAIETRPAPLAGG